MKIHLECILVLTLDFFIITHSDLPAVPSTIVIKPPPATVPTTSQPSLTIYYDAMEENSQVFFNTTFFKEFGCFASYVDISFIPCQLAQDQDGELTCQAVIADPLCNLDKVHSCAIAQVMNKTQLVDFLACTMSGVKKLPDFLTCAIRSGIDDQKLQTCASSDTGKNLCKHFNAQKMPACDTMPGFIFKNPNDIGDTDSFEHLDNYINDVCVTDFKSALCAQLKASHSSSMPQECSQKLVLGIFYKAMDANSQKWFQTFAMVYAKFSKCLTVKYEPCMFAELDASEALDCKDEKDPDCVAGKTHACAISMITDESALFQFINCTMQTSTEMPDFEKCATGTSIQYDLIKKCAEGDTGKLLCSDYSKSRPNSDKIPAFSYELSFDEKISEETSTSTDLQATISKQMVKYGITCPEAQNCSLAYDTTPPKNNNPAPAAVP